MDICFNYILYKKLKCNSFKWEDLDVLWHWFISLRKKCTLVTTPLKHHVRQQCIVIGAHKHEPANCINTYFTCLMVQFETVKRVQRTANIYKLTLYRRSILK